MKLPEYASVYEKLIPIILGDLNLLSYEQSAVKEAGIALREKQERDNPKPLRVDKFFARQGKPVYVKLLPDDLWQSKWVLIGTPISSPSGEEIGVFLGGFGNTAAFKFSDYGKTWLAYDHEPKGAE